MVTRMEITINKRKYTKSKKYNVRLFRDNLDDNNSRKVKGYG